jgi:hypothetical protein
VQLVLFAQNDQRRLYKHFLLLDDLVRAMGYNNELREFHGMPSAWVSATVGRTVAELHVLEPAIDVNDAWYAKKHSVPVRPEECVASTRSSCPAA